MIAAGVVLCVVVGYLAQPLAARGARWLWRGARMVAGMGAEIAWQVAKTIGEWSVETVELLNPWRRCAEVERKLAEAQCDLAEVRLDFNLARIEVKTAGRLLEALRNDLRVQKMMTEEAEKAVRYAVSMMRVP